MDALAAADISLFEDFRLDRRAGVLFRRDQQGVFTPIAIGRRALDILGVLVERPGDLVSRDEIIEAVWPGTAVEDSNLNVQIAALRRILDDGRAEGSCIQTVSGARLPLCRAGDRVPQPAELAIRLAAFPGQPLVQALACWPTSPPPRLSIVVLPFANLSDDREQQYFADGITDDLTTDLSRLANMFVISRNTAFTYKDKPVDTKQIGRELGVRYVLEGSVRRSGNQVRVNAQLIDAETDAHLWAERFDGDTGDLFALQDEITSRIAVALNLELIAAEAARPTEHPDALDYILRARAVMSKPPTRDNYVEAIILFERALALDPRSVQALARLAGALAGRVLDDMTGSPTADIERAEQLVELTLGQLPGNSLVHYAKGQVRRAQNRFGEAIAEYETSLALNRNQVSAYAQIGRCKLFTGSPADTILLHEKAIHLSPRDPGIHLWYGRIGQAYLVQSRIDEFDPLVRKSARCQSGISAPSCMACCHLRAKRGYRAGHLRTRRSQKAERQRSLRERRPLAGLRVFRGPSHPHAVRSHLFCRLAQGRNAGRMNTSGTLG